MEFQASFPVLTGREWSELGVRGCVALLALAVR